MIDCFVTFCEDDARQIDVQLLINELEARVDGKIRFLAYFKNEIGSSLNSFMEETLGDCACVLGLFGPKYKERIDTTAHASGAFQEYNTIVTRLDGRLGNIKPKIIPVLWAGKEISKSVPDLLMTSNPFVADLSSFRAHGTKKVEPFLPGPLRDKYDSTLDKIASALLLHEEICSQEVLNNTAKNLSQMLDPTAKRSDSSLSITDILQVKYEHGRYDAHSFRDLYFTKTRFSKRLKDRNVGLISGRKGSGKTTLVQIRELEAQDSDYFPAIDVSVNDWKLHELIQSTSFNQSEGDFKYIDLEVRFLEFVWAAFVSLSMVVSLTFYEKRKRKDPSVTVGKYIKYPATADILDHLIADTKNFQDFDYAALFDQSVTTVRRYIQNVVDRASADDEASFRRDVLHATTVRRFLFDVFGSNFRNLRSGIYENGNKRFLFCFDRFDTEIQQYRKIDIVQPVDVRQRRSEREINWLSSLVLFVNRTVRPDQLSEDRDIYEFFSAIKFLVVLPYDRIEEVRRSQRDSISSETVEEIRWQPKELLTMLRKRMQVLYNISDEHLKKGVNRDALKRFDLCKAAACPQLPERSYVLLGNIKFSIDLFLYVLRHTLFRPRDILIHYASILGYLESIKGRGARDVTEPIREIISQESQKIVEYEFIGELRDTWTNIDEILNLFMGSDQVVSAKNLEEILGSVAFKFYHQGSDLTTFPAKLEFLYAIGFLGFRSTRPSGSGKNQNGFNFDFMSSQMKLPFNAEPVMRHIEFAIHPMFVETLFLSTNHRKPVLLFDWLKLDETDRPE